MRTLCLMEAQRICRWSAAELKSFERLQACGWSVQLMVVRGCQVGLSDFMPKFVVEIKLVTEVTAWGVEIAERMVLGMLQSQKFVALVSFTPFGCFRSLVVALTADPLQVSLMRAIWLSQVSTFSFPPLCGLVEVSIAFLELEIESGNLSSHDGGHVMACRCDQLVDGLCLYFYHVCVGVLMIHVQKIDMSP